MTITELTKELDNDQDMRDLVKTDPTEAKVQYNAILQLHGYDEFGAPLSLVNRGANALERKTGIPAESTKAAGTMGLSMAGTVGGAVIGSTAGPVGTAGGAMVGSLAGEKLAEVTGLREPMDTTDTALALGMPGVGTAMSRGFAGAKYLARFLPNAGIAMSELAGDTAEQAVKRIRVPKEAVDAARDVMQGVNDFKIRTPKLKALLDSELTQKARASALPGVESDIKKLNEVRAELSGDGFMSFKKLMSWEKELNELKVEDARGVWKKASGILMEDVQDAANNPKISQATRDKASAGFNAFKQFITLNKSYRADNELDAMLARSIKPSSGDPSLMKFDHGAFKKTLRDNKVLNASFTTDELKSVEDAISNIGYITHPSLAGTGSQLTAGIGGVAAPAMYGHSGVAIGAGLLGAIALGLKTESGRKVIKYLATEGKGTVNALELKSMLGKVAAGAMSGTASVMSQSEGTSAFPNQP